MCSLAKELSIGLNFIFDSQRGGHAVGGFLLSLQNSTQPTPKTLDPHERRTTQDY